MREIALKLFISRDEHKHFEVSLKNGEHFERRLAENCISFVEL